MFQTRFRKCNNLEREGYLQEIVGGTENACEGVEDLFRIPRLFSEASDR